MSVKQTRKRYKMEEINQYLKEIKDILEKQNELKQSKKKSRKYLK